MDIAKLMKQAQEVQQKMQAVQTELAKKEYTGVSGGGLVTAVVYGSGVAKNILIDASLLNASEHDVLEDLVVAAFNDAKQKIEDDSANTVQQVAGGIKLPAGFKM